MSINEDHFLDTEGIEKTGKEEKPKKISQTETIRDALAEGATREDLEKMGFNPNTIRTVASQLKSESGATVALGKGVPLGAVATKSDKGIQVFSKGSPPEAIINTIAIPDIEGQLQGFEKGIKFGASLIVLGVRVAQELSAVGIQQAKPLIEMSREMRAGEVQAAKSASIEAAESVGNQVYGALQPTITQVAELTEQMGKLKQDDKQSANADPFRQMLIKQMEPLFTAMIQKLIPGAPGMSNNAPSGWVKETE